MSFRLPAHPHHRWRRVRLAFFSRQLEVTLSSERMLDTIMTAYERYKASGRAVQLIREQEAAQAYVLQVRVHLGTSAPPF